MTLSIVACHSGVSGAPEGKGSSRPASPSLSVEECKVRLPSRARFSPGDDSIFLEAPKFPEVPELPWLIALSEVSDFICFTGRSRAERGGSFRLVRISPFCSIQYLRVPDWMSGAMTLRPGQVQSVTSSYSSAVPSSNQSKCSVLFPLSDEAGV